MAKILVIEDDKALAGSVREWLEFEHHNVDVAHDVDSGWEHLNAFAYDVVVLDWQLPGGNGVDLCKRYRAGGGQASVLMLTGMSATSNKIEGLDAGADDYVTKPFDMKELLSRIRAMLRRPAQYAGALLRAKDVELDTASRMVKKAGAELQLKPMEYAVLEFFMKHPNQVVSPDALLKQVWNSNSEASLDSVYVCINRLRKKIDDKDKEALIETVHGVGYRLMQ